MFDRCLLVQENEVESGKGRSTGVVGLGVNEGFFGHLMATEVAIMDSEMIEDVQIEKIRSHCGLSGAAGGGHRGKCLSHNLAL